MDDEQTGKQDKKGGWTSRWMDGWIIVGGWVGKMDEWMMGG